MKKLLPILAALLVASCDMWDTHPYDAHFDGATAINVTNIERIRQVADGKDTLRIVFTGDTQGWLDDTKAMIEDINRRDSVDFVVHLGDLTNYGETQEFVWQRELLQRLNQPFICLIGNHDCLGTGEEVYERMFGPLNFCFIVSGIKFVCLNTNAMEYDYSNPIPNFDFMRQEWTADSAAFTRTVLCMHARPGTEQFNNNVYEPFRYYSERFPGLLFCAAGHEHVPQVLDVYADGILYYITANAARRSYYLFTITPEGYSYETVTF